MIKGKFRPSLN